MRSPWICASVALAVLAFAPNAHAFERQWHLGAGLGAAAFGGDESALGPAVGIHGAYGLSDVFDARLELTGSRHDRDNGTRFDLVSGSAGIAYKIDVIEWVPYVGLLFGYYRYIEQDPIPDRALLGVSTALGIDYALSRSFAVGLELRYHGGLDEPPSSLTDGSYFTGFVHAEYRWGW